MRKHAQTVTLRKAVPGDRHSSRQPGRRKITGVVVCKVLRYDKAGDSTLTDVCLSTADAINMASLRTRMRLKYGDHKLLEATVFVPAAEQFRINKAPEKLPAWADDYAKKNGW